MSAIPDPGEGAAGVAVAREVGEWQAVAEFLRGSLPFHELDDEQLLSAVRALRVAYFPAGSRFDHHHHADGLRILRSGAVDLRDSGNKLLDRLGEGESFHIGGLNAGDDEVVATVIEDALVYRLPDADYQGLRRSVRAFDRYFSSQRSRRLRRAARYQAEPPALMAPVSTVMSRDLLTVSPAMTVQAAAVAMAERRVSSALVVEAGRLVGILTDRDLRTRILAAGRDATTPVREVMSAEPQSIDAAAPLFEGMLLMTRCGFHHLPVLQDEVPVGVVTTSDLMLLRSDDPVYLVQHISRAEGAEAIREHLGALPSRVVNWVSSGMQASQVSSVLTAISDAVARRLITLAEAELGPAPAPWAWLAFGSQARGEQLLGADQDNGIVIDDALGEQPLDWYRELARRVCDGLAACGYPYCPGGVMATTETWCVPLARWQDTVNRWMRTPTPDALMRVTIFFDLRAVHGETSLAEALQQRMLEGASGNSIFLAALAANALDGRPPLGIFRRFVVEHDGEHRDSLDIKKRGVLPVTDIARVHALAHGIAEVNTGRRLEQLARNAALAMADARNLADALQCLQRVRIRHQCEQILAGGRADNFINPRQLPRLEREQLRDAFTIIDEAQGGLRQTYRAGLG